MKRSLIATVLPAVFVILSNWADPVSAQSPSPAHPTASTPQTGMTIPSAPDVAGEIPRLPGGHPNLQGLWHNDVGADALKKAGLGDIHSPGTPLPFPYFPDTDKIREYRALHDPYHDPEAHCHVPGVPRVIEQPSSIMPFRIIQDEKYVTILFEYVHDVRIIPEDGSDHPKHYWAWDGDSRGHWDGDTFVVDVADFNGRSWLDMDGNFVDENEHVVERFKMTGPNSIAYDATVEDPTVFTRPWIMHLTLRRNPAGDQIVYYDCHEGERSVDHYTRSEGNSASKHE
jgi:hypothetical protein